MKKLILTITMLLAAASSPAVAGPTSISDAGTIKGVSELCMSHGAGWPALYVHSVRLVVDETSGMSDSKKAIVEVQVAEKAEQVKLEYGEDMKKSGDPVKACEHYKSQIMGWLK